MTFFTDGLERFHLVFKAVEIIKRQVVTIETYEASTYGSCSMSCQTDLVQNFIRPDQRFACRECIRKLREILDLLDIRPLYHTILIEYTFERADAIRTRLDESIRHGTDLEADLQPTLPTMWAFCIGCAVNGRKSIRSILH